MVKSPPRSLRPLKVLSPLVLETSFEKSPAVSSITEYCTPTRSSMPMAPVESCWICGCRTLDRVWRDPFDLSAFSRFGVYQHANHAPSYVVRCARCGFGQPEALPALADFFEILYRIPWSRESLNREFDLGYKDYIFETVIQGLDRRRGNLPRTVLDIGAHVGRFIHKAREAGWDAEGVEFSPITASYAFERTGLPVHQSSAQDLTAKGRRYTAITLTDVLEHIPDPLPLMKELRELLQPGGVIAVKVPHGPMQIFKEALRRDVLDQADAGVMVRFVHVNHFTVDSLKACLENAGFRDVTIVVGAPEFLPATPNRPKRETIKAAITQGIYHLVRHIPGGVRSPLSMHLQAYATAP